VCSVNTNNYNGGFLAVDHLVSRGHKIIGCIHGVLSNPHERNIPYEDMFQFNIWRQRTAGFCEAMKKHGLDDSFLYPGNGLEGIAKKCIPGILDSIMKGKKRPTAIYCENDIMAVVLLNEMTARGLKAPDDLAIVGHDGLSLCTILHPYITTIEQPRHEMGFQAASILIQHIKDPKNVQRVTLEPKLLIGETT
jgi:DNA-binding LacI/PurR family transcriptional regulator